MEFKIGEKNVLNRTLINPRKIFLSSLNIKPVCEALDEGGDSLKYRKVLAFSCVKIKLRVLDGILNRRLVWNALLLFCLISWEIRSCQIMKNSYRLC